MRTTLTIDDDVLHAVRGLAQLQQKNVGEVLSALARQSLVRSPSTERSRNGVPLLPVTANPRPVDLAMVNQLRDELP